MSQEFQFIPDQSQVQQQEYSTLLWQANPEIQAFLERTIIPAFFISPDITKIFFVGGESGSGKGPLRTQGIVALLENESLRDQVESHGKKLHLHSVTTSDVVKEGFKRVPLSSQWGIPTDDEMAEMTRMGNYGLAKAEVLLPYDSPEEEHVIVEEFTAVADPFNVGTDILKRQGRSKDTAVIFVTSNAKTQARTYRKRYEMMASLQEEDPKIRRQKQRSILRHHRTRYDVSPDESIFTSGTHETIEKVCAILNTQMYDVFVSAAMALPVTTPDDLRRDFSSVQDDNLKTYFDHLTEFGNEKMTSNPIRQHLLEGYFTYLANKWGLINYLVVNPEFIEDEWIEDYPGMTKPMTLPLGEYVDDRYPVIPDHGEVFAANQ